MSNETMSDSVSDSEESEIELGKIIKGLSRISDEKSSISINDLALHLVVLGETGFGKTTLIIHLVRQLWNLAPTINWTIIDLKGEYLERLQPYIVDSITVLKPRFQQTITDTRDDVHNLDGKVVYAPLLINVFSLGRGDSIDGIARGEECAERVFLILKESLSALFRENTELSPMMEGILREALRRVYDEERSQNRFEGDDDEGFFDAVFNEIEAYSRAYGKERPDLQNSSEALKNRIDRFRRGTLGRILNIPITNTTSENDTTATTKSHRACLSTLLDSKIIVDLSECMRGGCSGEEIRLLLSFIMQVIFGSAVGKGIATKPEIRHLTIVEEASLLVPEVLHRRTMGDLTAVEDLILTARGFGEGLVLVAQRPTISSFVVANAGTKVVFRSPYDSRRIGEFMGLNERQQELLKTLGRFEAVVTTVDRGLERIATVCPQSYRRQIQKHDGGNMMWKREI